MAPRFADMFTDSDNDPRVDPPTETDERATIVGFLRFQRGTLELKCGGLDAADLARRSVDPLHAVAARVGASHGPTWSAAGSGG